MTIRAILWDFGDTLCDETWMLAPMPGAASWPAIFPDVLARDRLGERWNVGTASTADVATAAAGQLACDTDPVLAHMRSCCRDIRFYPTVLALAAACRLPQAIVTVNTDIFTEEVIPAYGLDRRFAAIVTSWQERSADKGHLCEIARRRLGRNLAPNECLLIDNLAPNIAAWEARGGVGMHFTGEAALLASWRW